jgi:uncharacterized protein YggT (Ycf19 family)
MAKREPKPPYGPDAPLPDPEVREPEMRVERSEPVRPLREPTLHPIRTRRRAPLSRLVTAVDYLFFILYGLLATRFVLALIGASQEAPFTRLIFGVTAPLYAPFRRIVERPAADGGYVDLPILVAMLGYVLLHVAVRGLIRVIEGRPSVR